MKKEAHRNIALESEFDALKRLFKENNINYEVTSNYTTTNNAIVASKMYPQYTFKILPKDVEKANQIIRQLKEKNKIRIEDYPYLVALPDKELIEMLIYPDASNESELVVRKILEHKGIDCSEQALAAIKKKNKSISKKGKRVSIYIQVAFFMSLISGLYLGIIFILLGIAMGFYYSYGKKADKEGERHYIYNKQARKNGKIIFYGGIIFLLLHVFLVNENIAMQFFKLVP